MICLLDDDKQPGVEPSRTPPCHFKPSHLATSDQIRASSPDVPRGQTGSPVRDREAGTAVQRHRADFPLDTSVMTSEPAVRLLL